MKSSVVVLPMESTKALFSTTIITGIPTAKPETSKTAMSSTAEPSQSVMAYVTGGSDSLGRSICCLPTIVK